MEYINKILSISNLIILILFIISFSILSITLLCNYIRIKKRAKVMIPTCSNCFHILVIEIKKHEGITHSFWNTILNKQFCNNCGGNIIWKKYDYIYYIVANSNLINNILVFDTLKLKIIKESINNIDLKKWIEFENKIKNNQLNSEFSKIQRDFHFFISNLFIEHKEKLEEFENNIFNYKYKSSNKINNKING